MDPLCLHIKRTNFQHNLNLKNILEGLDKNNICLNCEAALFEFCCVLLKVH